MIIILTDQEELLYQETVPEYLNEQIKV